MKRIGILLVAAGILAFATGLEAQQTQAPAKPAVAKKPAGRTKDSKIRNAMSAAPRSLAQNATVLDWPAKPGDQPAVLRKGTNDWTCFPDDPGTPANDPQCFDKLSMEWIQAYLAKKEPKLAAPGLGYMLRGGGSASNTDPFATKPAAGEKWMKEAPHVMVFPTGKLDPNAYGTDPHSGKPWIMWAGTPYEHLMIPVK
ncbi:MAG: hypothetical protein HYV62_12670 [Candidatus Rokubacteria bacterium]|nr:hypothetical protein [Candidatus Rokubacteria bacterium]